MPRRAYSCRRALPRHLFRRQRGAVLIVALLVAALIAIGLGSYLRLNVTSARLAKRTFGGYAALNLAETGAEEAVWSFNRAQAGDGGAWSAWTNNGTSAWQKLPSFDLGNNTTGTVKVYVDRFDPPANAQPKIVTHAAISVLNELDVVKMLELTLRRRSYFANGLVAKENVTFSGAIASVDSWNSDPDNDPNTAPVDYSAAVRNDRGTVASVAVVNSAVLINQANIWGYVATGGGQPQVGTNGTIRGADTPADVMVDPRRITTDFNADFAPVAAPEDGTTLLSVGATLGVPGTATRWRTSGITLSGNDSLEILGDVTLILTAGSGTQAIRLSGNATLIISEGSSLTLYVEGDVDIAGNGVANRNVQPVAFKLWGTNTSAAGQSIAIAGNGALRAAVYAPNGDVRINGNGDVMGSIVARNITLVGNADFHYDEALAQEDNGEPFGISKWRELSTPAERAPYLSVFEGW